jgi:hypothetical protein
MKGIVQQSIVAFDEEVLTISNLTAEGIVFGESMVTP